MKANRKIFLKKDTSAQVGIGTLIIFIAMVLVAAVAAAVLIQTSGTLQQKAQTTGKQATKEVSSNLMIKSIEGIRAKNATASTMSTTIDMLKLKVGLNVGSSPVDVNQVVISITDGTNANNLIYAANTKTYGSAMKDFSSGATAATNLDKLLTSNQTDPGFNSKYFFTAGKVRDEDGSFSQGDPIMNTGDLATMYISTVAGTATSYPTIGTVTTSGNQKDSGLDILPRTTVNIILTPESGVTTVAEFVTPSSYGVKETVQLYP